MESKKLIVPGSAQNGKATPAQEATVKMLPVATAKTEAKEPTAEELKKVIEDLNKRLNAIPQDLKTRVEYFNKKNELIRRLSKLDTDKETLSKHLDYLSEIATVNEYETEDFNLNVEFGNKYNKTAVYTVKNPVVIGDLLAFVVERIDRKREELRKQIEA